MSIEVAYARQDRQIIISLQVAAPCSVEQAIRLSGVLQQFPEIDLTTAKAGIFGQLTQLTKFLQVGDRVEIYRPLQRDPKQARRLRAVQSQKKPAK